jgi:hypothetical protein
MFLKLFQEVENFRLGNADSTTGGEENEGMKWNLSFQVRFAFFMLFFRYTCMIIGYGFIMFCW